MLKQDKNRKYSCPVQLAVYGHTVEGTIYLTIVLYKVLQTTKSEIPNYLHNLLYLNILFIKIP